MYLTNSVPKIPTQGDRLDFFCNDFECKEMKHSVDAALAPLHPERGDAMSDRALINYYTQN